MNPTSLLLDCITRTIRSIENLRGSCFVGARAKARWSPKYRTHINLSRNRGGAEFSGARSTFTSSSGCSLVAPSSWRNSSATFAPSIATRPAYAPNPQLGAARMSKPWNARLWLSSTCAVPRQFDEALAKSSAKQINFSRNAGSWPRWSWRGPRFEGGRSCGAASCQWPENWL